MVEPFLNAEVPMQRLFQELCPQEGSHTAENRGAWRRHCLRTTEEMEGILSDLLQDLHQAGYSGRDTFGVRLALEEAIVNAIKHGHQYDRSKQVEVRYHLSGDCLLAEIEDQGPGFDPNTVPDPLAVENLERPSGRGLHLIHCYMTWVRYNQTGNCVTMCKHRSPESVRGQLTPC